MTDDGEKRENGREEGVRKALPKPKALLNITTSGTKKLC
jgi:hypothetical protein